MKKIAFNLFSASLLAVAAASALAHGSTSSITPTQAAISTSSVSGFSGSGGGASIGYASNQSGAGTTGANGGMAAGIGPVKAGNVDISGGVTTYSNTTAGGIVTGPGASLNYGAGGTGQASVVGQGEFHTVTNGPSGVVNGNAESISASSVQGTTTGAGSVSVGAVAGFQASANADQFKLGPINTINVGSQATGLATTAGGQNFQFGGASVAFDNQAAFNSFGQAKVGTVTSTNGN